MLDWGALNDRGPMSSSAAQTLQKLYFTILGVPMDVQMQDLFAKQVTAENMNKPKCDFKDDFYSSRFKFFHNKNVL